MSSVIKHLSDIIIENKKEIDSLKNQVSTLHEDKSNMDKKIINLEQKIKVLESSCVTSSFIPSDKYILEIKNRLDKLNNLILYDVPEDLTPDNNFDHLINLFGSIDKNLNNLSFKRLGVKSDKNRPIQISSDNKNNINKIIQNYDKLPEGFKITQDRTLIQRKQYKSLVELIKSEPKSSNDINLKKVKYVHGVPRILSVKNSVKNFKVNNTSSENSIKSKRKNTISCSTSDKDNLIFDENKIYFDKSDINNTSLNKNKNNDNLSNSIIINKGSTKKKKDKNKNKR